MRVSHYKVWTQYKGERGVLLFSGNKRQCNAYIRQAVKKGAQPNHFDIAVKFHRKGEQ